MSSSEEDDKADDKDGNRQHDGEQSKTDGLDDRGGSADIKCVRLGLVDNEAHAGIGRAGEVLNEVQRIVLIAEGGVAEEGAEVAHGVAVYHNIRANLALIIHVALCKTGDGVGIGVRVFLNLLCGREVSGVARLQNGIRSDVVVGGKQALYRCCCCGDNVIIRAAEHFIGDICKKISRRSVLRGEHVVHVALEQHTGLWLKAPLCKEGLEVRHVCPALGRVCRDIQRSGRSHFLVTKIGFKLRKLFGRIVRGRRAEHNDGSIFRNFVRQHVELFDFKVVVVEHAGKRGKIIGNGEHFVVARCECDDRNGIEVDEVQGVCKRAVYLGIVVILAGGRILLDAEQVGNGERLVALIRLDHDLTGRKGVTSIVADELRVQVRVDVLDFDLVVQLMQTVCEIRDLTVL